jgi:hypothetical protein
MQHSVAHVSETPAARGSSRDLPLCYREHIDDWSDHSTKKVPQLFAVQSRVGTDLRDRCILQNVNEWLWQSAGKLGCVHDYHELSTRKTDSGWAASRIALAKGIPLDIEADQPILVHLSE